jgi:hypothetical protein
MSSSRTQSAPHGSGASTENGRRSFAVDRQPSLFNSTHVDLSDTTSDSSFVRESLVSAIRQCGKSRAQIAEEMSELTGTEVTVRRLNAFTAESREDYRFPMDLARAFCAATNNYELLFGIVGRSGLHVITETEMELLRLGREYLRQKRASESVQMLERKLGGLDL